MKIKKYLLWLLIILFSCFIAPVGIASAQVAEASSYEVLDAAGHATELAQINPAINNIGDYYAGSNDAYQDDWKVMEMSLLGREGEILDDAGTLIQYIEQVTTEINPSSLTSYTKAAIVLTSLGIDVKNLDNYGTFTDSHGNTLTDLIDKIANFDGALDIYGAPFALLAYDSGAYSEPSGCPIGRAEIIDYLLSAQLASGLWDDGWSALYGFEDVDTTAMVISALAPYYDKTATSGRALSIKNALNKAVNALSSAQEDNGAFSSWGSVNSNSTAVVALALAGLDIDPAADARFIKSGASVLDGIFAFETTDGFFGWDGNTDFNDLSTEQVLRSLIALKQYYSNDNPVYLYRFGTPTLAPKVLRGIEVVSMPAKTLYYLNEDLLLSGLSVKAVYNDDSSESLLINDDMVSGYNNQTVGPETITITHQGYTCSFNIAVAKASSGGSSSKQEEVLSVSLQVLDDEKASVLSLAEVEIKDGDRVLDILKKALKAQGLTYSISSDYVKGINGLFEKDNGPNSGWLYTVNGTKPYVSAASYKLSGGEKIVFYYTNDYTSESAFEEETTAEEATVTATATAAEAADVTPSFPDMANASSWAQESISKAVAAGIIQGDDQGKLNPKDSVTRAQWIVMLLKLQQAALPSQYESTFSDVAGDSWYWSYLQKASAMGIISGKPDGSFGAGEYLSREDMAVIIANLYGLKQPAELPSIADINQASSYALSALYAVYQAGIMTGDGQNINPQGICTREEAITIIIRLMELNPLS